MVSLFFIIPVNAAPQWEKRPTAFEYGIIITVNGQDYYFAGPPIGPGAPERDVPGHAWVQADPYQIVAKHYNVGPFDAPSWWATNEPNGVLLYMVHGIIMTPPGELTETEAQHFKDQGYVHAHELLYADDPNVYEVNEDLAVYLKHTAVRKFNFNGGPAAPGSNHLVTPGIDYQFIPNW